MNFGTLACATLAFGLLSSSTADPRSVGALSDSIHLAWDLKQGATYIVESNSTVATTTVTMGREQVEAQDNGTIHKIHVDEVTEEGNMLLKITVDKFSMVKETASFDVELAGERDEDGEITVSVDLSSDMEQLEGSDVQELFEELVRGSMGVEFEMLVTPQGLVLESSVDGDPLANLPTDTDLTKMIADSARVIGKAEDMPGMLASQLFTYFPEASVEVGDDWSMERSFVSAGLEMDGAGDCTLDEFDVKNGTAHITEHLTYELGTAGLAENMVEMMELMLSGQELDLAVDLDGEDVESIAKIEFNVEAGFLRSMSTSELVSSMSGTMTFGEMDMDLEVVTNTSGSSKWSLVKDE